MRVSPYCTIGALAAAFVTAALEGKSFAQALTIGVDFGGRSPTGSSVFVGDATAGVVPQRFWNSVPTLPSNAFSGDNIVLFKDNGDGSSNASGVTLTFMGDDAQNSGGPLATGDDRLNYGILKTGTPGLPFFGTPETATISLDNVPAGTYRLIAYTNVDSDDDVAADLTLGGTTYYTLEQHQFTGSYIQGVSTDPLNRDAYKSNYVQWDSITPTANQIDFTITWQGGGDGVGLGGFQLIRTDVAPLAPTKTWSGANGPIWDVNTTPNWNGATQTFEQGDEVIFDDSAANRDVVVQAAEGVAPSAIAVNNSAGLDYTFSGNAITGVGTTLTKTGGGALAINNNSNSFTGTTFLRGGTIVVATVGGANANGALGRGGELVFGEGANPATLVYTGTGEAVNRFLTVVGGARVEVLGPTATLQFDGDLNGTAPLTKAGPGVLSTTGVGGSFSGAITIEEGTFATAALSSSASIISLGKQAAGPAARPTFSYTGAGVADDARGVTVFANNGLGGAVSVVDPAAEVRLSGLVNASEGPLRKTGQGTLTLGGTVTLTAPIVEGGTLALTNAGGTNVVNGTVTVNADATLRTVPTALGNASVTLSGGTLALQAAVGTSIAGFGDGSAFALNRNPAAANENVPAISNDVLQITSAFNGEATSVWNRMQQNIVAFVAKFTYRETGGTNVADGAAFVLQNAGLNALGGEGGGIGYSGITPSAALQINIYAGDQARNGGVGLAYNTNGASIIDATAPAERATPTGSVNLRSGNPIDFTLTYDGSSLGINLAEQNTTNTYSTTRTTNLPSILGGNSAFVGFTGGTGGLNAPQFFSNFLFSGGSATTPDTINYGTNVNVVAGTTSTVSVQAITNNAVLGNLSVGAGSTFRATGDSNVKFNTTTLAGDANFSVDRRSVHLGTYQTPGSSVAIGKSGNGNVVVETSASNPTLANGSALNISAGNVVAISESGRPSPIGNATINFSGTGGLILSSKSGPIAFNNLVNVGGNNSIIARQEGTGVAGPLTVSLGNGLNIPAPNSLSLGTANNYTILVGGTASGGGNVVVSGGNVTATTDGAFQGLAVSTTPSSGTALLRLTSLAPTIASLSSSGAGTSRILLGNSAAPANNTTLTINGDGTDTRFAGIISGGGGGTVGSVIKAGTGNLTLAGNNTFAGGLTVNSGILELGANGAAGTGQLTLNGGTLRFSNAGLLGQYFNVTPVNLNNSNPNFNDLATFNAHIDSLGTPTVTAATIGTGTLITFSFNADGDAEAPFASQGFASTDNIEARFRGKISVPTTGIYNFATSSDDGSLLAIDGTQVVENNMFQGIGNVRTGSIELTAGVHDIDIGFYEGQGGAGIIASWQAPGAALEPIPLSVLSNVAGFAASNVVQMVGSSTFDLRGGNTSFAGGLKMAPGLTLTATDGNLTFASAQLQGAGVYNFDKGTGNLTLSSVADGGNAVTINKSGAGNLILRATAAAQLTDAANVINVTGGAVTAVVGVQNPLGASVVNLNGGGLNVSSTAGDVTLANAINVNQNATLGAGNFGAGAVNGPVTATIAAAGLNIAPGLTVTTQSSQGYTLKIGGNVAGGGSLIAGSGTTNLGGTATLDTLTVNGNLRTTNNLTASSGTTVNQGGALSFNPGAGNTATYTGSAMAINGGALSVESGVVNFGNAPVNINARTVTSAPGTLQAQVYAGFVNPDGGFGSEVGLANTLARTPSRQTTLTGALNFGPLNNADAAITNFFGAPTQDAFTAVFSGKFFAPESGDFTFGHSLNDDGAAVFLDLNQNGVFETMGSAGNEQLSFTAVCCGNADANVATAMGTAALVQGQSYKIAVLLQDTGGGASVAAFYQTPSFAKEFINPGEQSLFSSDSATGGGNVSVGAGAQLLAGSLAGATEISLAGGGAVLQLNGAGAVDSAEVLRVSGGDSFLELGAGHQINVGNFTVAASSRFVKNGTGNMTVAQQSLGTGSTFEVNGGVVELNGALGATRTVDASSGSVAINNGGTVRVNGAITGSVQVASGGTLGGNGTVGAVSVSTGGTLAPGREIGTLNSGALSLASGATLRLQLSQFSNSDAVNVTGTVALDQAVLQLAIAPARDIAIGDLFFIVVNDDVDAVSGTFANAPTSGSMITTAEGSFEVYYTGDSASNAFTGGNDVVLRSLVAVPEPGALGLLGAAGAALLGFARRRRA